MKFFSGGSGCQSTATLYGGDLTAADLVELSSSPNKDEAGEAGAPPWSIAKATLRALFRNFKVQ